jgi:hypothetical protein
VLRILWHCKVDIEWEIKQGGFPKLNNVIEIAQPLKYLFEFLKRVVIRKFLFKYE